MTTGRLCVLDRGQLFDELQPVHHGHVDIAKNQLDPVLLEDAKRFGAVSASSTVSARCRPDAKSAPRSSHDRGIVDDEGMYAVHEAVSILGRQSVGALFCTPALYACLVIDRHRGRDFKISAAPALRCAKGMVDLAYDSLRESGAFCNADQLRDLGDEESPRWR